MATTTLYVRAAEIVGEAVGEPFQREGQSKLEKAPPNLGDDVGA